VREERERERRVPGFSVQYSGFGVQCSLFQDLRLEV
jgi:hypothetical protein